jgi:YYY domain-containing protein
MMRKPIKFPNWLFDVFLLVVLVGGACFRFTGINWDEDSYNHPDERFLAMTAENLVPVASLADYFNTSTSSLNPANQGSGFYVYGTLPLILVRYTAEWIGQVDLHSIKTIGRTFSALADLGTVFLAYLIAVQLYKRRTALLTAAFSALAVLQIQQSHFFTVDNFVNFFIYLAIYFAIRIVTNPVERENRLPTAPLGKREWFNLLVQHPWFWASILFGISLGAAMACKINAAPVTLMLPAAIALQLFRHPVEERTRLLPWAVFFLILAAFISLVIFRCLQPYAFNGPGFFNFGISSDWISTIKSLSVYSSRDVDYYPPAYQWARRPVWFSFQNIVQWGLGLPLGILAWASFLWAGVRMLKGEFRQHILLWGWTAAFFAWQSLAFNATMRYELPIYPSLAIFAAWGVMKAWALAHTSEWDLPWIKKFHLPWKRILVGLVGGGVFLATFAWAFAFTGIYTRSLTRVEASRWIYQNLPGPLTIGVQTEEGLNNQPLSAPYGETLQEGTPFQDTFASNVSGDLSNILMAHVLVTGDSSSPNPGTLHLSISSIPQGQSQPLALASLVTDFSTPQDFSLSLSNPVAVTLQQNLTLNLLVPDGVQNLDFCQPVQLEIETGSGVFTQPVDPPSDCTLKPGEVFTLSTEIQADGELEEVFFSQVTSLEPAPGSQSLIMIVSSSPWQETLLTTTPMTAALPASGINTSDSLSFAFDAGINIEKDGFYMVRVWVDGTSASATLEGTALANEGDWDDGLPYRLDGYDAYGGIYVSGLNFNMYDDDNAEKLVRFESILDDADYIAISSNRQWGSLTRLSERFPLTTFYYRELLGCPDDKEITWCYSVAEPGMFSGSLGYELVQVFESDPTIGSLSINDQFAEEAFTVYDHPKVLIFKKSADYNSLQTKILLSSVDLTKIIPLKPGQAGSTPADLLLPVTRWVQQLAGGTWSLLFSSGNLLNQSQILALVCWYLVVAGLGLIVYPLVRLAFPGLSDRGYPLARLTGMLILALLVWLAGSAGIAFSRTTISLVLLFLALIGGLLAYRQRDDLRLEWKSKRRYFLTVEIIALTFFAIDLAIRLGNPDLWHPAYGGEKPMDFSFFNAVLKSTTFPPYDPWFSGGYMNYYYYGYVVVGVLVKWLGITPSVAYNLILPTLFSLLALGAFSIGWNLSGKNKKPEEAESGNPDNPSPSILKNPQLWIGLAAAAGVTLLGNLGTVRMIWQGLQLLVVPSDTATTGSFLTRCWWAIQGFFKWLGGNHLPYSYGDWYWKPSRAIQPEAGNEITEFPFFSFLYADLHASTMSLPIAVLSLNWAVSVFLGKGRWGEAGGRFKWLSHGLTLLVGAVVIGALRPTNTWDIYTYLPLGVIALGYSAWRSSENKNLPILNRLLPVVIDIGILVGLTLLLYKPFSDWFGQAYSKIDLWKGNHTLIWSYLVHWGLFLFILFSWLLWETLDWMASTPLSALRKLRPYLWVIEVGGVTLLGIIVLLMALDGVQIAWLPLLLAAWAAILIFRPGLPDPKRAVLFLTGTALVLTLVVEVIVLHGDINRQNTVFKLYLQAWTLFGVSAAVAVGWLWQGFALHRPRLRLIWQIGLAILVGGTILCTVMMTINKIKDRMASNTAITLDGMAFMQTATYTDGIPYSGTATTMDLNQDYEAIRWMQENVLGSPVIVEANIPIYHWGSRFTIYTGLPGVLGWDWHEIQQRGLVPSSWITDRQTDIAQFYTTTDPIQAQAFIQKYDVTYIIVGQYEKLWYPGTGLEKFDSLNGTLWERVYQSQDTAIYKVMTP